VPGLLDYLNSVPPQSSAKQRATKHALFNLSSLTLFALAWFADRKRRRGLPLALETAGTATLCVGGWMGGTLAYRNQIGVDHRYANAGKWQEARIDGANADDSLEDVSRGLEMNQMKLVHVGGKRVAVGRTGKGYAAFQDRCTHKGGPLSDGVLMCGTVQCPWHGSQFDVLTGEVKAGPAEVKIETYDVHDQKKKIGA
jgi:nitrite reductase/ring-hydroxylating ferredoxin subunit